MFIRIVKVDDEPGAKSRELLINLEHISKIEVHYSVRSGNSKAKRALVDVAAGRDNPYAQRWYKIHVGGEIVNIPAEPNSKVAQLLDGIYRDAVNG